MIDPDIMSPERKADVCNEIGERMAREWQEAMITRLLIVRASARRWRVIRLNGTASGFLAGSEVFSGTHEEAIEFCMRDPK